MPDPDRETRLQIESETRFYEEIRLHEIYVKGFTRGFLDVQGKSRTDFSEVLDYLDPNGDTAYSAGYVDGVLTASSVEPKWLTQLGIQNAVRDYEDDRLRKIYTKAFAKGFLEAWNGHPQIGIDYFGPAEGSPDPDGEEAAWFGWDDAQMAVYRAKVYQEEQKLGLRR